MSAKLPARARNPATQHTIPWNFYTPCDIMASMPEKLTTAFQLNQREAMSDLDVAITRINSARQRVLNGFSGSKRIQIAGNLESIAKFVSNSKDSIETS